MRKHKLFAAITLSLTLAMSSVAYGEPIPGESEAMIDSTGPVGEEEEEESPLEPGQAMGNDQESEASTEKETKENIDKKGTEGQDTKSPDGTGQDTAAQPVIQSEGAVLLDAATGTVLYGKNENTQFYPASITKLMTGLLAVENCSLDDTVTFSAGATTNLESGSVTLSLTEGDVLTVEDCMYALLLKSANEVANGLAEKVSGSVPAFAKRMNERAKELGCRNTNFVNPNGLNNENHRTTPYDMALIARAAFANKTLQKIDSSTSYKIPATKKVNKERTITMGHKMFYSTDSRYYPGIIGGKTGYTSKAGNTLVTGAEKDGVRLIVVIMKSKATHYQDTKALLDYGFANRDRLLAEGGQSVSEPGTKSPAAGELPEGPKGGEKAPGTWKRNGSVWNYVKEDKTAAAGEWLTVGSNEYWFDPDGSMAVGWRQFTNGDWYYFDSEGIMVKERWVENGGKLFYLGSNGAMLKNTTTPDGYQVDAEGARQ